MIPIRLIYVHTIYTTLLFTIPRCYIHSYTLCYVLFITIYHVTSPVTSPLPLHAARWNVRDLFTVAICSRCYHTLDSIPIRYVPARLFIRSVIHVTRGPYRAAPVTYVCVDFIVLRCDLRLHLPFGYVTLPLPTRLVISPYHTSFFVHLHTRSFSVVRSFYRFVTFDLLPLLLLRFRVCSHAFTHVVFICYHGPLIWMPLTSPHRSPHRFHRTTVLATLHCHTAAPCPARIPTRLRTHTISHTVPVVLLPTRLSFCYRVTCCTVYLPATPASPHVVHTFVSRHTTFTDFTTPGDLDVLFVRSVYTVSGSDYLFWVYTWTTFSFVATLRLRLFVGCVVVTPSRTHAAARLHYALRWLPHTTVPFTTHTRTPHYATPRSCYHASHTGYCVVLHTVDVTYLRYTRSPTCGHTRTYDFCRLHVTPRAYVGHTRTLFTTTRSLFDVRSTIAVVC